MTGGKALPPEEADPLKEALAKFRVAYSRAGKPKIGIILVTYDWVGPISARKRQDLEAVHIAITDVFKAGGGRVVDLHAAEELAIDKAASNRDARMALGVKNIVGLLALVNVSSTTEGKYELRCNGKLLRTTDGSVVGTALADAAGPLTRVKINQIAQSLSRQIMEKYAAAPTYTELTVTAHGLISQDQLSNVVAFLEGLVGVSLVEQSSYSRGRGELYVEFEGSAASLYDLMGKNKAKLPGFRLRAKELDRNNIDIESVDR